jgi:5-methylcytosine-specific restriction endonuclease McrA
MDMCCCRLYEWNNFNNDNRMKKHTRIYLHHFGYAPSDFVYCEICLREAVDIHHIDARGMGGSEDKDTPDNLMALCRKCHEDYGDKKQHKDFLKQVHKAKLDARK